MKNKNHSILHNLCQRGAKLKQEGDFKGALTAFNNALTINPYCVGAYQGKVNLPGVEFSDKEIHRMEQILSSDSPDVDLISISFALARVYDKKAEYKKSFTYLQIANGLKRRQLDYNISIIKNDVVTLLELFTESEIIKRNIPENNGKKPIFIIGMPRSGTTLTEQIISSHPNVFAGGEMLAFGNTAKKLLYPHTNMLLPRGQRLRGITKEVKEMAIANYIKESPKTNDTTTHITDKMPYNFLNIGWINMLFNKPVIIHVHRNKMATLFSCYQQNFAQGSEWSYNLGELHTFYDSIELLTQYWGLLFPGTIYDVWYEDIVENQEEESRKLISYCELPWNDSCLSFEKNKRKVLTASVCQVRQPIYKKSLDHWKNYSDYLEG